MGLTNEIDKLLPGRLIVECHKCTRTAQVPGDSYANSERIAYAMGWRVDRYGLVCPTCPGGGDHALDLVHASELARIAWQQTPARKES